MTTTKTNQPALTLRDRGISVTIWCNATEKGPRYSAQLSRSYTDQQGNWKDTNSLSQGELLRAANLLTQAYNRIQELKKAVNTAGDSEGAQ